MSMILGRRSIRLFIAALFIWPRMSLAESDYRVGPGDLLNVSVALQGSLKDFSQIHLYLPIQIIGDSIYSVFQVAVSPDGTISIPSVNRRLLITGSTLSEAERKIANELNLPSRRTSVSVALVKADSEPYFVWGEVKQAGRYVLERPTSLLEGLSYAGGPTDTARLKDVTLLRPNEKAQRINLSPSALKKTGLPPITLRPYDAIIVPKRRTAGSNLWFLVLTTLSTFAAMKVATDDR